MKRDMARLTTEASAVPIIRKIVNAPMTRFSSQ